MRTKQAFPLASFKVADRSKGTFEAIVSVFGNIDVDNDIVLPGAFADSLKSWEESGDPIPVIWSHMWNDPFAHIGKVTEAVETKDGLQITGQLDVEKPFAAQVYDLMAERRIKEFSFAYDVIEADRKGAIRELKKLNVWETGPTLKGANPETQLIGVKAMAAAMEAEVKTAIASHSTATSDGAWDGPANEANLSTDAGASTYRKAYAWQDPDGDPDVKASYKFIHHEVSSDGDVGAANLTACSTGIGVLNGGRGGTAIPDSDREGVHAHLARHMRDGDMEPPELKSQAKRHTKAFVTLEGSYESTMAQLWGALQDWGRETYGRGAWCMLEATYDDRAIVGVESWDEDSGIGQRYYEVPYTFAEDGAVEFGEAREVGISGSVAPKARGQKEGRRNSTTDAGRLQNAHDLLVELGAKCSEADDAKREEPQGAKRDELPSPASLHLWAELQALDST